MHKLMIGSIDGFPRAHLAQPAARLPQADLGSLEHARLGSLRHARASAGDARGRECALPAARRTGPAAWRRPASRRKPWSLLQRKPCIPSVHTRRLCSRNSRVLPGMQGKTLELRPWPMIWVAKHTMTGGYVRSSSNHTSRLNNHHMVVKNYYTADYPS